MTKIKNIEKQLEEEYIDARDKQKREKYIEARDKLIKQAEMIATDMSEVGDDSNWQRRFILEMDRLAVENGIQEYRFHPTYK